MHPFILHNGEIHEASSALLSPGQVGIVNGWGVFSTVRVAQGVLFAFERHFERMRRDAELMRIPFPSRQSEIEEPLLRLVEANNARESTLRVLVVRNRGGMWEGPANTRDFDLIAFTTGVKQWGAGVRLGLVQNARFAASRFAGTKILSWSFNLVWLEEAQANGLDEAILLNERGEVSECTSANVFISQGNRIWTPPLSSGCLPGITRQLLLSDISVPGISIGERTLRLEDLEAADEVFITSTTRALLPVFSIEGLNIRTGGAARAPVQEAFERYVESYVAEARAAAGKTA
ncbi:MAG: aminotransferase class IV [Bryobacteraceae bacterium]|nr:aminotransferase class IV [Bryobacteraceae bacterium]